MCGITGVFGEYFGEVRFANASALEFGAVAVFGEPWFAAVDVCDVAEDIKERGLFHTLEGVQESEGSDWALEREEFGELANFLLEILFGSGHRAFREGRWYCGCTWKVRSAVVRRGIRMLPDAA